MTFWRSAIVRASIGLLAIAGMAQAAMAAPSATDILDATGVKGGLIVHVGCGDGRLTAALHAGDAFLVHGLDTEAENVEQAREHIRSKGLYGPVSASVFDGRHLPYADDLVNLVVAEDLGEVDKTEVLRVLAPGGVAYIGDGGKWTKTVKPRPDEIDEWTHFLHDASNNAVANDTQVDTPRRLKWTCGPLWTRSHEFNSSVCAMVSAGGRVFYVLDEGLTGITAPPIPERWMLVARDAFNGVLLWKRPLDPWGTGAWRNKALRSIPATVPRSLVAEGDRVFMTLGYGAAVSILDAATGRIVTTCEGTEGASEIRCSDGVLIVRRGTGAITAGDATTGKALWEAKGRIRPLTPAVCRGKVFFQDGKTVSCLGLKDGKPIWRKPAKAAVSLLLVHEDRVVLLTGRSLEAVSADTGETLWTADSGVSRRELFIAAGQLWHWQGDRVVGRDMQSGKVKTEPDTSDVFTPGHHLRCYQSKATENFLITPYRGVEFVNLAGGEHSQNDWVRGPCTYGIMPCNGLLYAPPNPCFCYPGVKLTGFNALAPAAKAESGKRKAEQGPRLQRGAAYGKPATGGATTAGLGDWPTYRHDARRSGATAGKVSPEVSQRWKVTLGGPLTPPVVAGDRVFVAAKNEHTLHALAIDDGRKLWQCTVGGRIDSPPTIYGALVLFGSADGHVYCLRAADGERVWRFRAAPSDRQIVAFGQLESPWRVHGSILLDNGLAYCTAGRSTYLDGGIRVFALDPATGKVVHETCLDTWARTREDAVGKPFIAGYHIEGAMSDVLVSEGDSIFLGQYELDRTLAQREVPYVDPKGKDAPVAMDLSKQPFVVENVERNQGFEVHQRQWVDRTQAALVEQYNRTHGHYSFGDRRMGRHVLATGGFLDDSWYNRTFWMYSESWPGFYLGHLGAKTGHLLVVGPKKTYALQAYPERNLQSPLFTPGGKGYLLFADANDNEPVLDHRTRGTTKGWGFTRSKAPVWHHWIPVRVRGMVLAGECLFVAGPPDVLDPDDPMASFEGRKGALLRACSADGGKILSEQKLEAPPVFDGLIAASGRLVMSATDGSVVCFGPE